MTYKTGEQPQVKDEVLGQVDGRPARGRVVAVLADQQVRVTRRAAYQGPDKPLAAEHVDLASSELSLVYRPRSTGSPLPAPSSKSAEKRAKAAKGAEKK